MDEFFFILTILLQPSRALPILTFPLGSFNINVDDGIVEKKKMDLS